MIRYCSHIVLMLLCCLMAEKAFCQQVNLENALNGFRDKLKQSKKIKFSGGLNASATFTKSSVGGMRDPFVYTLSGNMSVKWMSVTIPINLNFTNAGFSYSYSYPRLPSRLSLHPAYKNYQAHLGDFSMSFSPYTMSGFQIVGAGLDVKDIGNWSFSGFYGRFQKAVEYNPSNGNTVATYARNGFGFKATNNSKALQTTVTLIRVQDKENSLQFKPDSFNVLPKANVAMSLNQAFKLAKNLKLTYEVGASVLTNDVRSKSGGDAVFQKITNGIIHVNNSTNFYKAVKTNIAYTIGSSNFGFGYERIDPGYQTLAAYYFANDFENFTANFAQQLFKGKVNLSSTIGLQRDNLLGEKTGSNNRIVMSFNGSVNAGKKITSSFSYSNFQSFTNIKPQFQTINQLTPYDNLDTLNYRQLSQNASISLNYMLRADKDVTRIINCVLSLQDSYDEQGGIVSKGNASTFYNMTLNFTVTKVPSGKSLSAGANFTYNTIGKANTITGGPTVMYSRQLFNKKVRVNLAGAYNKSIQENTGNSAVLTSRFNANYTLKKKHQLSWMSTYMHRNTRGMTGNDFSTTFNYTYSF